MSDGEEPGRESLPGPGGKRLDARERMRRKLEGIRAAATGDGTSKVTRLPRRPRRVAEEGGERPHKTWHSDGGPVYDPAPTRPVLRSELERGTGWWQIDPGAAQHPAPEDSPDSDEHDASVVDLDALRRKRSGADAPAGRVPRMPKPRRIRNPDSPPADGPTEQH